MTRSPESDQGQLKNGSMFFKYQTQMVSVKRQCPYNSFGTLAFEICLSFESQMPRENIVPLGAMTDNEQYVHTL